MKIFAPALLLALVATQAIAAPDIAGVQIGLPLSTQESVIEKANPSYLIKNINLLYGMGKSIGINAIAQNENDQFVVVEDDAGIVWFVARYQLLEKGARIKPETLLSSLKDKYGIYTALSNRGGFSDLVWQFDRQGNIYQGQPGPCYVDASVSANADTYLGIAPRPLSSLIPLPKGRVSGTSIHVPGVFSPKCGVEITTSMLIDPKDEMVNAFTVQIVDVKRMYDQITKKAAAKQINREQDLEAEKIKDIQPKL